MHIHICPVEISAALMTAEHIVPYVKTTWCYHVDKVKQYMKQKLPVTVWSIVNEGNTVMHNHIEDGHVEGDTPTAKTKQQENAWKGQAWKKEHAYIQNNIICDDERLK